VKGADHDRPYSFHHYIATPRPSEFIGGMAARRAQSRRAVNPRSRTAARQRRRALRRGRGPSYLHPMLRALGPKATRCLGRVARVDRKSVEIDVWKIVRFSSNFFALFNIIRTGFEMDPARTCSRRQRVARRDRRPLLDRVSFTPASLRSNPCQAVRDDF
jgi:hypothetical protein